jgi:hypothetical protein
MVVKLNPAQLDHSRATAHLLIKGLSVMLFNPAPEQKRWEVAFPREKKHLLELTIEGNGHQQTCPEEIDLETSHIDISVTKPIVPDWKQFPRGFWFRNPFSRRLLANHYEDFRWVPDFCSFSDFPLHGRVRLKKPGKKCTILTVGNVIFYTKEHSYYELHQSLMNDNIIVPLGKANNQVGADIRCENGGEVIVRIDGRECARLRHVPGKPYTITLSNQEPKSNKIPADRIVGKYKRGDFKLYYNLLDVDVKFDLLCPDTIYKSRDCDCETVHVSNLSVDAALQLSFLAQSKCTRAKAEPAKRVGRGRQANTPNHQLTKAAKARKGRAKK